MYISVLTQTTPTLKACIIILMGRPLSRNSSVWLDHLQLFTNENCKKYTRKVCHEVLSNYYFDNSTTETHHPHQSPANTKVQDLNNNSNHVMYRTNTPTIMWLRCIILWPRCWIMLQCPPLVRGHLLRFPYVLPHNFLHFTTLSGGSRSINQMMMDQGLQIIRRYREIGVDKLKTLVIHWKFWYIPQIENIWFS